MKREDIYIEVTPETIGAYEEVLRRHGEKLGDMAVTDSYRFLGYIGAGSAAACWFVDGTDYSVNGTTSWTPEEFDKRLTELKAAEASVESVADTSVQDEQVQLYAKNGDSYIQVTLCRDHIVAETPNGSKVIVEASNIYTGTLKPFQP